MPDELSGATVFATSWDPASLSWTPLVVAYAPAALGLDPGSIAQPSPINLPLMMATPEPPQPLGPYVVLDVFVRPNPANQFVSLTGQPLRFVWGALSPTTFDTSLPLLLTL
ncbi:MAG TPA: hypothetical protein ENI87_13160 [bacterium]|nr:hypothetical protein [bacterium]